MRNEEKLVDALLLIQSFRPDRAVTLTDSVISFCAKKKVATVVVYYAITNGKPTSGTLLEQALSQPSLAQHRPANPDNHSHRELDEKRFVTLRDDERQHFQPIGSAPLCYVDGTDAEATLAANTTRCHCQQDYFGKECGIPAAVWHRTLHKKYHRWPLKPRKTPRRIIHGFNINHELDFFQVRLEELQVKITVCLGTALW